MKKVIIILQFLIATIVFSTMLGVAGGSEGIFIFDISQSPAPVLITNIQTGGYSYDIDFVKKTVFIADGTNGVSSYAVDEFGNYEALWNIKIPDEDFISIKTVNKDVFAGTNNGRLYQFASDKGSLKKEVLKLTGPISDIEYSDGLLYVCGGSSGVVVLDGLETYIRIEKHYPIRTPIGLFVKDGTIYAADASGFMVTNNATSGRLDILDVEEIFVRDNTAFIANGPFGLKILDVSDPSKPEIINGITFADAVDIELFEDIAYLSTISYGLVQVDISDMKNLELKSVFDRGSYALDIKIFKDFLIVSDNRYLKVYKLLDGGTLELIEDYRTPFFIRRIFTTNDNVYAMGLAGKILELNIGENGNLNPRVIASEGTKYVGTKLGNYIINAEGVNGLVIYEIIGDDYIPVSQLRFPGWVIDIVITGTTGYILAGALYILDFSVPFDPVILSEFSLNGYPVRLELRDNKAYIASEFYGLIIVDIANSENPKLINENQDLHQIRNISIYENYAFISSGAEGIKIFSTDDMQPVGYINTPGLALSVTFKDSTMYVADHSNGIIIVDISDIRNPKIIEDLIWAVFHNHAIER